MLFDQFLLLASTLLTFGGLLFTVKLVIRHIPALASLPLVTALDQATDIMDPNALLAFIVGLVASVGVLLYINLGSE